MTLLADGMAFVNTAHATAAGVSVSYTRGPTSAALTVVVGDQQVNAVRLGQVQQATTTAMDRDYLIVAADLDAAGFDGPPAIGDRITETIGGVDTVFELMRQTGGGPPWRWSDGADRLTYRVHTKRV